MASKPELERLVSATERTVLEKKELVMNNIEEENKNLQAPDGEEIKGGGLQPTEALKQFFNHVSLFSAPGISNAEGDLRSSSTLLLALRTDSIAE